MECKCKDCQKRTLGCHDTCPDYLAWRKWKDESNARERQIKMQNYLATERVVKRRKGL